MHSMRISIFLAFAVVAFTVIHGQAKSPNILLIVADDQGWNDIGYHNSELHTPNIDRLAKSGVELDCHYVQPQCTPTRVALMTGRYPTRFGLHCAVASNDQAYPVGTLTMASMLKSVGYETGMSGKWHMGSKPEWGPNQYGFDYAHGSLAGAVGMYDHRYRLNTPFAVTWHRNGEWIEEEGHVTDLTAGEAVRWIESHADRKQPWFFYVPFHAVHTPLAERDAKWADMNANIDDPERRLFAAALSHMDDAVGQMITALDATGQRADTLVIYTSDNGAQVNHSGNTYPPPDPKLTKFSSNAPLRGAKTETFEGGFRVPAFVNWPGKLETHKVDAPLHVVDWMPTLAGLVGYEIEEDPTWDGTNIWPLLTGELREPPERAIYTVWGAGRNREAIRYGDWKLVRNGGNKWLLFDVANDPNETTDLAARETARVEQLMQVYGEERKRDAK